MMAYRTGLDGVGRPERGTVNFTYFLSQCRHWLQAKTKC